MKVFIVIEVINDTIVINKKKVGLVVTNNVIFVRNVWNAYYIVKLLE